MRFTRSMVGHNITLHLERDRNEPGSGPVDVHGVIARVRNRIATVTYQVPWHRLENGYVTYLDGSESTFTY
jgi:extradiol dioxygenase family protein